MSDKVTIVALQQMKRDGKKIAGVVAWDTPMARIAICCMSMAARPPPALSANCA